RLRLRAVVAQPAELAPGGDQLLEVGVLAGQPGELRSLRDHLRMTEQAGDLVVALLQRRHAARERLVVQHARPAQAATSGRSISSPLAYTSTPRAAIGGAPAPRPSRHRVLRIDTRAISSCWSSGSRVVIFCSHMPGADSARATRLVSHFLPASLMSS